MIHARQPRKPHDGSLFWPKTVHRAPSYPVLQQRISTEVAIIGGGMTGAICAAVLARHGIPVAVIEGQSVASGSTAANAGLIQFTSDIMLSDLADRIGEEPAVRFYQASRKATVGLAQLAADTGEDTGFYSRSSLYCASCEDDMAKMIREYSMLRKYDFPVTWGIPHRVGGRFSSLKPGAVVTHGDAETNPVKLTRALLAFAVRNGAKVYENSTVLEVARVNGKYTVLCEGGEAVASLVVKATGYLPGLVTPTASTAQILKRTYALATAPGQMPEEWPDHYMMWETARPYFYFRTTPDGRIIAGGSDEALSNKECDADTLQCRAGELLDTLGELFPDREWQAEEAWCGTFGESADGLPIIGEHPEQPGLFHALGVGGNGTVYAMIAAAMLRDQLLGKENPLSAYVSPARPLHTGDPAFVPFWPAATADESASMFA